MVTSLIAAALARVLPAGFRERQRSEWLGDLAQLDRAARWRYVLTATLTFPSLYLAARRSGPRPYAGWAIALPRRTRGYVMVTSFAIATALLGAALAGRLSWDPPPPLLTPSASQALQETVFPGRVVTGTPDAPAFGEDADGWIPGGSVFAVPSVPVDRDLRADTVTARDRLAAAGWAVDDDVHSALDPGAVSFTPTDTAWSFTAHNAGLVLEFGATRYSGQPASSFYYLHRTTYPHAPVLLLLSAGALAGLAGWLAACSLHRRVGDRRGRAALRAASPTVAAFAVVPTAFLLVAREFAAPLTERGWTPAWFFLFVRGGEQPYGYAVLISVFAVGVAMSTTIHAPIRPPHWDYADEV